MLRPTYSSASLRRRWPLALLLASIALTATAVFAAQRTGRSNRAVTTRVLHDYASFVAWAYAQHLAEALRLAAQEALGPVNHGDQLHQAPSVPTARDLAHFLYFDNACCHRAQHGPNAEAYFAFNMASTVLDLGVNTHPNVAEGWEVDRPMAVPIPVGAFTGYAPADRDAILRVIKHLARDAPDSEHGYTYLTLSLSRGPRVLVYTLMPTVRGDTMVYGVQYTAESFASLLGSVMRATDILPKAFSAGRRNSDLVDVAVLGANRDLMFASGDTETTEASAVVKLSPGFAALTVLASFKPDQAASLVVGGLPASRLPFLLGLLGLAAGLTVVAVMQLRREAELARLRADWIASVSHELRTPLAQIRLYVDTIRLGRAADAGRQAWALSNVDRETTRLSHLVEKVLSFSRFGRGVNAEPHACDVNEETRRIVSEFRPLAATRNAGIETDLEPVPTMWLQRDSLRHILLNLLDNAVKYGPAGQTVRVHARRVGGAVEIRVSDQGPGVPASERDAVWRPFTRGAQTNEQGGSGIGLTIVREVATQHGGHTWVEDAPGGGAQFVVSLPVSLVPRS